MDTDHAGRGTSIPASRAVTPRLERSQDPDCSGDSSEALPGRRHKHSFPLVFMATSSSRAAPDFAATASSHIGFRQLDPIETKAPSVLPSATTIAATAPRYGEPPLATRSQGLCLSACLDDNSRTQVRKLAGPLERISKLYLSAHTPHVLASRSACACMCTKFLSLANPERHVLCTCRHP